MTETPITITLTVRCRVSGEYNPPPPDHKGPPPGPYFETQGWMTPAEAVDYAAGAWCTGKYKRVEISTHTKTNGRWKFAGRAAYPPNEKSSNPASNA